MSLEQHEEFLCPYCGGSNLLQVDITGGHAQEFVVDCEICCAPIVVCLSINDGEITINEIKRENE